MTSVQSFFNTGDEDAYDDVADADDTTAVLRFSRLLYAWQLLRQVTGRVMTDERVE